MTSLLTLGLWLSIRLRPESAGWMGCAHPSGATAQAGGSPADPPISATKARGLVNQLDANSPERFIQQVILPEE